MPNASEPLCLAFVMMMMVTTLQPQPIKATFPVDADLSLKHPSMRRRATGSPHHHHSSGMRITAPETDDPITQRYILYHVCSRRLVRIFGGKIDARGRQETIYNQLRATTDSFDRIRIQSIMTDGFVCFNRHARLVVRAHGRDDGCYFKETMTADHYTEFQSTYNTSWYLGFSKPGTALRGSHWKTEDEVNQKAIKCRKFLKKQRPERNIKETAKGRIKGSDTGRVKAVFEEKIKVRVKEKKIGHAERRMKGNAERRTVKDNTGIAQYKTG